MSRFLVVQADRRREPSALGPTEREVRQTLGGEATPGTPALAAEEARVAAALTGPTAPAVR